MLFLKESKIEIREFILFGLKISSNKGSKFIFSSSPHRRKKGKSFRLVLFYNDQHQFSRENIDTKMAMLINNSDGKTCLTGDEILPRNYPERKPVSQVYLSLLVTP